MKNQACWKDLNAQSSQKVIEELSDAFQSWFDLRHKDSKANPPGYRKHGDKRPKSTVTFKEDGFKHDSENNRVRLSKGSNFKEYWSDFLFCEYQTRPDVDLSEVESVQNVLLKENEWNTSKTCSKCGDDTKSNRKHRGLYVCSSCGLVGNADCNGAENMRQKITPSPHGEDRSNGCVAQPSTHLFDSDSGVFAPREQVVS
jgi:transposase